MNYPRPEQYQLNLQVPRLVLIDPELKDATIKTNAIGLPAPISGSFALTYQFTTANCQTIAVRCFYKKSDNLDLRYKAISAKLHSLVSYYFLDFEFQSQGIIIDGKAYPIVKMEWAKGETLAEFLEENYTNKIALRNLRFAIYQLANYLETNSIAHGDIQLGNLIVSNCGKHIQLIDYDGMYVPEIAHLGSSECGCVNFQHPQRNRNCWDDKLDRFAFIQLYFALCLLETEPTLYTQTGSNPDKLLFSAEDYRQPEKSMFLHNLMNNQLHLRLGLENFVRICKADFSEIPTLAEFLENRSIPNLNYLFGSCEKLSLVFPTISQNQLEETHLCITSVTSVENETSQIVNIPSRKSSKKQDRVRSFQMLQWILVSALIISGVIIIFLINLLKKNSLVNEISSYPTVVMPSKVETDFVLSSKKPITAATEIPQQSTTIPEQFQNTYSHCLNKVSFTAPFANGQVYAKCQDYHSKLWGFIDNNGHWWILPKFVDVGGFYEGLAAVKDPTNKLWGYINIYNKYIIPPEFTCVRYFSEGLAPVLVGGNSESCTGGKWGYINTQNQWQINPVLDMAKNFKNGRAEVIYQGYKGYISYYGNWIN